MTSPIEALREAIHECMMRIAPERDAEIRGLISKHKVAINLIDEASFNIRTDVAVNPGSGTRNITVPIQALEYLWAFCHLCWVLYQEYQSAQKAGLEHFDTGSTQRIRNAIAIQHWGVDRISDPCAIQWPEQFLNPALNDVEDVRVANELFLCALAWVLHHELGHSERGHTIAIAVRGRQEELEADCFASKIILQDLERSDPRLKKRALGVACAVLALQSLEVAEKPKESSGYPGAHERLANALYGYEISEDEVVDAFSVAVLQLLFARSDVEADIDGALFSEILSGMLVEISRA